MQAFKLICRAGIYSSFILMAAGSLTLAEPAKPGIALGESQPTALSPASPAIGVDAQSAPTNAPLAGSVLKQPPLTAANFVSMASQDGLAEVEIAKLALRKAKAVEVRTFAQQMVRDHERANTELKTIASTRHLQVADSLDTEHKLMLDELASKSGSEFDAAYAQHMNAAHTKAVALFQQGAVSSDADVAMFASRTLPTLHAHQQMAVQLKQGYSSALPADKNTVD